MEEGEHGDGFKRQILNWGANTLRKVHLQSVIRLTKDVTAIGILRPLHLRVLHRIRKLSLAIDQGGATASDEATQIAQQVCSEARMVVGKLLELPPNKLHCCLKVMVDAPAERPTEDRVGTWVRSEPLDDRPMESGADNAHLVSANTVWSALMGRSDGLRHWRSFACFGCNDLMKHGDAFRCDRESWSRYYRSALVFPIRYPRDTQGIEFDNLGFLAFDSPKTKAFGTIPDIFKQVDDPQGYRDRLERSSVFNLGSIIVDTLGVALRNIRTTHGSATASGDKS